MLQAELIHTLEALALADDVVAVRAAEYIYERLESLPLRSDETAIDLTPHPPLLALQQSIETDGDQAMGDSDSIRSARFLLCQFAKQECGNMLVLEALQDWNDDTQRVGVQISWGIIATLLLTFATTEVRIDGNGYSLHKKAIIPSQIDTIINLRNGIFSIKAELSPEPHPPTSDLQQTAPPKQTPALQLNTEHNKHE